MQLICIAGPTATGKTRLGVELGRELKGEVVSCDSMQIYKGMDIGTAKPSPEEPKGVPHHMLDVASPYENYSVGRYVAEAQRCVHEIVSRGMTPIVVGGTGLYMDSLVRGESFAAAPEDDNLRNELEELVKTQGKESLLEILREFDAEAAERIHPNNVKRIIRAIEIYRLTGETITEHDMESKLHSDAFDAVRIVLSFEDREKLYERINKRVDIMLERGLLEEVKGLLEQGVPRDCTAMAAIGYKELVEHIEGKCSLEEAVKKIKQNSRRYAKRQLTWFRRYENAKWIYVDKCGDFGEVRQIATDFIKERVR